MQAAKKSEMLEIRVSHQTKEALKQRAEREHQTVSEIVRDLISRYLLQGPRVTTSGQSGSTRRIARPFWSLSRLPVRFGASMAAIAITALSLVQLQGQSLGHAQDIVLEVDGTFFRADGAVHAFGTILALEPDEPRRISLGEPNAYEVSFVARDPVPDGAAVLLELEVKDVSDAQESMVMAPDVEIDFSHSNRVEFIDEHGGFYSMTIRAAAGKNG